MKEDNQGNHQDVHKIVGNLGRDLSRSDSMAVADIGTKAAAAGQKLRENWTFLNFLNFLVKNEINATGICKHLCD